MTYQLGDVVPLSVTVKDTNGQPANATAVNLTVTLPDGTTDPAGPIAPTTTGVYDHDYPTVQAGRHGVRWVATGTNASAYTDAFDVEPADDGDFVSLADVKQHLRKTGTEDDAQLSGFVSAACRMIEERVGAVSPTSATQRTYCRPSRTVIILDQHPVISVTSVTDANGDTIPPANDDTDGWVLDGGPGVLRHSRCWPYGPVTIVYRPGRTPLPGNIRLAGLELSAHLWRNSQLNSSGGRPALAGQDDVAIPGAAYALPLRVRELLGLGKLPTGDVLVG